jgi:hypothetical protein
MEITVDASELKDEGKEVIQGLANFIKEKTNAEVTKESNRVTVKGETLAVTKKYLRVLLKKFLHKKELKENTLRVKERKLAEED